MPFSSRLSSRFDVLLAAAGWRRRECLPHAIEMAGAPRLPVGFLERNGETLVVVAGAALRDRPDPAETYEALFHRYLDLSSLERMALWAVGRPAGGRFLLCIAPEGTRLLDVEAEMPLGHCPPDADEERAAQCLKHLTATERRTASPDREGLSADLVRWFELLGGALGPKLGWSRRETQRLGYQLILGLKALADGPQGLPRASQIALGFEIDQRDDAVSVRRETRSAGAWAEALLEAAEAVAPAGAGAFSTIERRALRRQFDTAGEAVLRSLEGLWQQAAVKRRPEVMLGLLTSPNHEHASWRLALTDPLNVASAIASMDFYVFEPLELDLGEVGFGRVLEAVEKLAQYGLERNAAVRRAGGRQLDFIESPPEGMSDNGLLSDPFNWLFRHALRLRVAPPYREALGYLLALHVLDLRTREPFRACPAAPLVALPAVMADPLLEI